MKHFDIKEHVVTIYLAIVFMILVPSIPLAYTQALFPLFLISLGIHLKKRVIGIFGIMFFYLFSVSQIIIESIEQVLNIIILSLLILLPCTLLLGQVLLEPDHKHYIHQLYLKKKLLFITIMLTLCFIVVLYLITIYLGAEQLISKTNIQEQILLIAGISILIFVPFILKNSTDDTLNS